jgi:outer membrane protein assembly factor BamB
MHTFARILCVSVSLLAVASVRSADWPQWRGPHRDAVVADPNHPLDKLAAEPKVLWKIEAGPGQASPILSAGRVVYMDLQGENETAHCVDAATGKELWKATAGPRVVFSPDYGGGPRCTPLIDEDRLYTQTGAGEFHCLSLADGKVLWKKSFANDYGATWFGNKGGGPEAKETASRRHGNNGSAVVDGERIFVPVGSPNGATLVCFDKKTGKEIWKAGTDNTAYSSVMVGTLAGVKQVVHFTADALMGVNAAKGNILWRVPLKTGAKRHACTPVLAGDSVTVASTSIGTIRFGITKSGEEFKATPIWTAQPIKTVIGTPTLVDKHFYTLGAGDRTSLVCLDFASGEQLWAEPGFPDYTSITAVNDKLLALLSTGELRLLKVNPAQYEEIGRAQLCAKTWASPAYADGKIYVKDEAHVTAFELAP